MSSVPPARRPGSGPDRYGLCPVLTNLFLLLSVCAIGLAVPGPSRAQSGLEPEHEGIEEPAPSLFDRLDFHPRFSSRYTVNRTSTNLDNGIDMEKISGPLLVSNKWNVRVQKNETQNNRRQQTGTSKTRVDYTVESFGGWSLGTDLDLSRRFATTDFNRTVDNATALNLVTTSGFLGELIRDPLGLELESFAWDVTGAVGLSAGERINQTRSRTTGELTRADSTSANGTTRQLETVVSMSGGPTGNWNLQLGGSLWRGNEDSDTEELEADSLLTLENSSRRQHFHVLGDWKPTRTASVTMNVRTEQSVTQEYNRIIRRQDRIVGVNERAELAVGLVPLWGIKSDVRVTSSLLSAEYDIQDSDRQQRLLDVASTFDFTTGRIWGFLSGTDVSIDIGAEDGRVTNTDNTADHYDTSAKNVAVNFVRPIGRRLSTNIGAEAILTQRFYEDPENDQDVLRTFVDGSLVYDLAPAVDTGLNFRWNEKQTVNIASSRAQSNSIDTDLRIGANYTWAIVPWASITQRYAVTAESKALEFRDVESQLVRTSELRSSLDSSIGRRVALDLEHLFRYKDSGQFALSEDGIRRYGKDREEDFQHLEVTTEYNLGLGTALRTALLRLTQKYEIRETTTLSTGDVSRREKTEISWGTVIGHQFDWFDLDVNVERTSSTQEPSYWSASARVTRTF